MEKIPLIKPYLPPGTKERVCEVLDGGFLTEGPVTKELESLAKEYIGCRHALAVTSCTTGLELALRALGIGPGDEVIAPDYTYPATADAIAIVGAKPVIVDVSKDTMLMDYDLAEKAVTPATKAIMPVSEFGNPLDHDRLAAIKKKHKLHIIEDAACSLGSEYKEVKTGNIADISVFSMHPRKFITSGEGGIITTNNAEWADAMESYKHFGMRVEDGKISLSFDHIGTNYKLSNILAAVAVGQMKMARELLSRRVALAENYKRLLSGQSGIKIPSTTVGGKHSYQTFSVFIDGRDKVMANMRAEGIEVQIGTYSLHLHRAFQDASKVRLFGSFEGSRHACEKCLALPMYHEMDERTQKTVVEKLLKEI